LIVLLDVSATHTRRFDGALGVLLGISAVKAVLLEALHRADKMAALQWAIENIDDSEDIDLPAR
jgi:hypothetical protein